MTTPQPRPNRPAQTTPVIARPVAAQPRQATINDLAYELREIRLLMRRTAAAKRRGGLLLIIFGGLSLGAGILGHVIQFNRQEQAAGLAALQGVSRPAEEYPVTPAIFMVAGAVLVLVGGAMQYDPERE